MHDKEIIHEKTRNDTNEQKNLVYFRVFWWNKFLEWRTAHCGWVFAFILVLAMRAWFAILGAAAITANRPLLEAHSRAGYHGLDPVPNEGLWLVLAPWQRWDAMWYLRAATFGYAPNDESASFFPLFPVLMRALGTLLGENYLLAGVVVCTLAVFFAFGLLYRLSADWADEPTARRAVLYWAIFPTSYYLFGGYAESILAACALASVYFARQNRWLRAAIFAAGATLSRPIGFLILAPIAIQAYRQASSLLERARAVLPPALGVAIAMGAWMAYLQIAFGDALLWVHAEDVWQRIFVLPGQTVWWTIQNIFQDKGYLGNNIIDLTLTAITLAAILTRIRKLPIEYSTYALLMLVVPLLNYSQAGIFASMPMAAAGRRAMVVFPAFITLGSIIRGRWIQPLWAAISFIFQAILFVQFTLWTWID